MRIIVHSWLPVIVAICVAIWILTLIVACLFFPIALVFEYAIIGTVIFAVVAAAITLFYILLSDAVSIRWSD
jgi:hypothetical protein